MALTLWHTAQTHCATFDRLRDRIAPGLELRHVVRPEWLARSQGGVPADVAAEIASAAGQAEGPVLCTCTTIGPVAETVGALRVDWPMMQAAARLEGAILVAYALDSTRDVSLALLDRALQKEARHAEVRPLPLAQFWPLFEAGERMAFDASIAAGIREAARRVPGLGCVVLAQVSMAEAAPLLDDLAVPVLSAPDLALRAAMEM